MIPLGGGRGLENRCETCLVVSIFLLEPDLGLEDLRFPGPVSKCTVYRLEIFCRSVATSYFTAHLILKILHAFQ